MNDYSDSKLVDLARGGNQTALGVLLGRYQPVIQRQLQRFPIDAADRSDLVQDAMVQVMRRLHTFRGDSQFSTWLYRVTANAALMRMRSDRRRRQTSLDDHEQEAEAGLERAPNPPGGEWAVRADVRLEEARRRDRLQRALDELPEAYREVVLEHYLEGAPLQALADRLGTTESSVRSRLHRARTVLRERLRDADADAVGSNPRLRRPRRDEPSITAEPVTPRAVVRHALRALPATAPDRAREVESEFSADFAA
jgi:RNA polymerase sigma-70 factor (ECF subfamily)